MLFVVIFLFQTHFGQVGCDPFDTTGCDCAGNWLLETDPHEGPECRKTRSTSHNVSTPWFRIEEPCQTFSAARVKIPYPSFSNTAMEIIVETPRIACAIPCTILASLHPLKSCE